MKHKIMIFGVVVLLFLQGVAIRGEASEDVTSSLNVENVIGSTTELFSFSYVLAALPTIIITFMYNILLSPYTLCIAPLAYGCLGCLCCVIPAPFFCCYKFISGLETIMVTPCLTLLSFCIMPLLFRLYQIPTCQKLINGVAVRIGGLLGS